jgi:hypothetical protein
LHADHLCVWWVWVVGGVAVWLGVGLLVGVVIGRGVRMADGRSPGTGLRPWMTTADLPSSMRATGAAAAAPRMRRRSVPLPPVGIALVVLAVALETAGYVARLTGASGPTALLLSMDAPYSAPRLFVAGLFVVAAVAAVAGAGLSEGRRTWWLAVGVVAAGVAVVKAGSTLHADAMQVMSSFVGSVGAVGVSAGLAVAVVGGLWRLSRDERRDRRRVLGSLSLYALAVVGLSAVSSLAEQALGGASSWAIAATYLEETGEALAGVAFLMAVLVGVAPRLVLPASWALRRRADAQTVGAIEPIGQRPAAGGSTPA